MYKVASDVSHRSTSKGSVGCAARTCLLNLFASAILARRRFVAGSGASEVAQRAVYAHDGVMEVVGKAEELMKRIGPFIKKPVMEEAEG